MSTTDAAAFQRDGYLLVRGMWADAEVRAIRSAVAQESRVWVYAGAGVVAESEPEREWAETALKFRPMLEAHGFA